MKKIVFSIILLSLVSLGFVKCKKSNDLAQQSLDALALKVAELEGMLKKIENEKSKSSDKRVSSDLINQVLNNAKYVSQFLFDQFKFFMDKGDKVISKKFFIGVMFLIGPLLLLENKVLGLGMTSAIIKKITGIFVHGGKEVAKDVVDVVVDEVKSDLWFVAKLGGIWVGIKAAGSFASSLATKIGGNAGEILTKHSTLSKLSATTGAVIAAVTAPKALVVTVPLFLLHRYYSHNHVIPNWQEAYQDFGLNYIFGS
ncbi:hypothetical protein KAT08_02825 [Candidatus Babeliales bacterium]|nr:hypothetical protein [Candidatus Babeliales bacterium]